MRMFLLTQTLITIAVIGAIVYTGNWLFIIILFLTESSYTEKDKEENK